MAEWVVRVELNCFMAFGNRTIVLPSAHVNKPDKAIDYQRQGVELACLEDRSCRFFVPSQTTKQN
jgi:hypothetical protein